MYLLPAIDHPGRARGAPGQGRLRRGDRVPRRPGASRPSCSRRPVRRGFMWSIWMARSPATPTTWRWCAAILARTSLKVEVGGGVRSLEAAERLLDAGATRVILGTALVRDPDFAQAAMERFGPDALVAGIDAKAGEAAVAGWTEGSGVARRRPGCGAWPTRGYEHIVYTDIARDGMQTGVEGDAYAQMAARLPATPSSCRGASPRLPTSPALAPHRRRRGGRHRRPGPLRGQLSRWPTAWPPATGTWQPERPAGGRAAPAYHRGAGRVADGLGAHMLTKRVIPCLDVKDGRVVKGVNFVNLRDAGDPIELACALRRAEGRRGGVPGHHGHARTTAPPRWSWPSRASERAAPALLRGRGLPQRGRHPASMIAAGADKVSVNSAAVAEPLSSSPRPPGPSARRPILCAIDAKAVAGNPRQAGRSTWPAGARPRASTRSSGRARPTRRGAGEILLTSMDRDGSRDGFDCHADARRGPGRGHPRHRQRAAWASSSTSPRASSRARPTPCSPPASSISASLPCAR